MDANLSSTEPYRSHIAPGITLAGRFTLVKKLGEGGMGEVWVAQQDEPVKRKVAVKFIKQGMDSRAAVARFEAERQALAIMDHPHIARIFDGGIGPDGSLFFAMELVEGSPLLQFCDHHRLDPRQRIALFVPICQAVQHAHQKGVIHRDLKPSNVLVAIVDGRPVPKIIDFGVAKAIGGKLTASDLTTQFGAAVGTLEYMAPEQAAGDPRDVDTRADLYALGVMLYELLTGLRPFDGQRLRRAAIDEVARILRDEEPSKPSTRLSSDGSLPSLAAVRSIEPRRLLELLRGELDWVVMKCIEKDRNRRYETANNLARELERYLANEPVDARPPSAAYRFKKFIRRHRPQVIAAGLLLLALIGGMIGTSYGLYVAENARMLEARRAEGERSAKLEALTQKANALAAVVAERAAKEEANRRLLQVQKANKLLGAIFDDLNLREVQNRGQKLELVLGERLKRLVADLTSEAVGDPLVVAELQEKLGISLRNLGFLSEAVTVAEEVHATRSRLLSTDDPVAVAGAVNLGSAYTAAGRIDEALTILEQSVPLCKNKFGRTNRLTLEAMHNLASLYSMKKQLDQALPLMEEIYQAVQEVHGPNHVNTLNVMNSLAAVHIQTGNSGKALPLLEQAADQLEKTIGVDHPDTLVALNNLAQVYHTSGRIDDATTRMEQVVRGLRTSVGGEHPHTLIAMSNLASVYHEAGKMDQALPLYLKVSELQKQHFGADHPDTIISLNKLGMAYWATGELDKCLPVWEEVLRLRKAKFGPDHMDTLDIMGGLSRAYLRAKKPELGLPLFAEMLTARRRLLGPENPQYAGWLATASMDLLEAQQFATAEPYLREAHTIFESNEPRGWRSANTKVFLGESLLGQQKYDEAEVALLEGYKEMQSVADQIPTSGAHRPAVAVERLIELYTALEKIDDVQKWTDERARIEMQKSE